MKHSVKKIFCISLSIILVVGLLIPIFLLTNSCNANKNSSMVVSKSKYMQGEEIVVTASGDSDEWVGIYREKDNEKKIEPICQYPVYKDGFLSGQSYILQRSARFNESRNLFKNFPAVKYKAVLFGTAGTNKILKTEYFAVENTPLTSPTEPQNITYKQNFLGSGLADGSLKVEFDENNFNATELLLYWADDSGILEDWTSLAKVKVSSNPFNYQFVTNTIIPPNATKIRAYSVNKLGISEGFCQTDLPQNSGYDMSRKTLTKFQVVSDVHIAVKDANLASQDAKELHAQHLKLMAEDVVKTCPQSSALIVVGDIANSGQESEWQKNAEILNSVEGLPATYYAVGNHDLYSGSYKTQINYFYKYANVQSVYYEKEIAGFHHIFLGSESNNKSGVDADLTEAQLDWFENRLKVLTENQPDKQIFVYLHQSLYNTIAGSFKGQGWNGVMQDARLREILKKYPQVYMFNGHSHWELNSVGNFHGATKDLPNIFNTASVGYLWSSYDKPTGEYLRGSQGYYIRVYQDKVLVLGRDFEQGKYVSSACYEAKMLNK